MTNADPVSTYTNAVGKCLQEPINEVIETKCYYTVDPTLEEKERANSWIIVSSPSSSLDAANSILSNIEMRNLDEGEEPAVDADPGRVYPLAK